MMIIYFISQFSQASWQQNIFTTIAQEDKLKRVRFVDREWAFAFGKMKIIFLKEKPATTRTIKCLVKKGYLRETHKGNRLWR